MPTKHFELVLDSTWCVVKRNALMGNDSEKISNVQTTNQSTIHETRGRAEKYCGLDNLCYRPSYAGANNVSPQLPTTIVTSLTLSNV